MQSGWQCPEGEGAWCWTWHQFSQIYCEYFGKYYLTLSQGVLTMIPERQGPGHLHTGQRSHLPWTISKLRGGQILCSVVNMVYVYLLGYPVTSYFDPNGFPSPSASTLAMMTLSFAWENASATCSYIGARFWKVKQFRNKHQVMWTPSPCNGHCIASIKKLCFLKLYKYIPPRCKAVEM